VQWHRGFIGIIGGLLAACSAHSAAVAPKGPIFRGMCDASGAVPLTETTFAVADDEDNVIRVYDAERPGTPVASVDLSLGLGVMPKRSRKKGQLGEAPETDIEGAARVGDHAFWITSHGLNSSGKRKPERFRFFATSAPSDASSLTVLGRPYQELIADLIQDPRYAAFALERASERPPKQPGGLNLEGLSQRAEGGLFIGFRNPLPEGKALLAPLLNPGDVVQGSRAAFGAPVLLDLGGLGIRDIVYWRGRYLLLAGASDAGTAPSQLFVWNGRDAPRNAQVTELRGLNPEGLFAPEDRTRVLILSDDGTLEIDGGECKGLHDATKKSFRGLWIESTRLE
jgi:hypothetical protein